jgi:hypothetical protein
MKNHPSHSEPKLYPTVSRERHSEKKEYHPPTLKKEGLLRQLTLDVTFSFGP